MGGDVWELIAIIMENLKDYFLSPENPHKFHYTGFGLLAEWFPGIWRKYWSPEVVGSNGIEYAINGTKIWIAAKLLENESCHMARLEDIIPDFAIERSLDSKRLY